jgi:Transglycosylase-like domain
MRLRRLRLLPFLFIAVPVLNACTPLEVALYERVAEPYQGVLSDAQLSRLRNCESHGNYESVSQSGRYRGAYQFSRSRWDSLAQEHFPWLVGVDPAMAEPAWQDLMARALWSESGPAPWPVCGARA